MNITLLSATTRSYVPVDRTLWSYLRTSNKTVMLAAEYQFLFLSLIDLQLDTIDIVDTDK
jgi:hypothetical protein